MKIYGKDYKTVSFEEGRLFLIDQNKLPDEFEIKSYADYRSVVEAIQIMTVRGAPAIGAAGAFSMAMAALSAGDDDFRSALKAARQELIAARPTAVDLSIGVMQVYEAALKFIPDYENARKAALLTAEEFARRSEEQCYDLGVFGAELIPDGARILTHCNAGALATVDHGTALAVIRAAHHQGKDIFVYVDETRPRLQGARLTAFELEQEGIPHAIITDAAAGYYFWKGEIDLVITGADRICLNGDIANKIGTYEKAVLAKEHNIPFYIAAPKSTFDFSCARGEEIVIEFRDEDEIKYIDGNLITNEGSPALNPAFDVTPARYISKIITPLGNFGPTDAAQRMQS